MFLSMNSLLDMANKLKSIDLNNIFDDSVMETKDSLLDENRNQLLSGKAIDGSILGRYTPQYAKRKAKTKSSNAPFGIYDFKLTGSFQDDMYLSPKPDIIEVGSIDLKERWLEKYGNGANRVFGLPNGSNYPEQIFKPVFSRRIKEYLNI